MSTSLNNITVVIPNRDTPEHCDLCIDLLLKQTLVPDIWVIDTSTTKYVNSKCSVLPLKHTNIRHIAEPVARAMDYGFENIATDYFVSIHTDVFLMSRHVIATLYELTQKHKVVGFRNVPRCYPDWHTELGHALLMCHLPTMRANGVNWSLDQFCNKTKLQHGTFGAHSPDTESNFNRTLKQTNIVPHFLGYEDNRCRNTNNYFDHCRGYTSAKHYDQKYYQHIQSEMLNSMTDARLRLLRWQNCPYMYR